MKKLPAVEDAKALLSEGMEWSIWRWLLEKSRVRRITDEGTAVLDELEKQVKAAWPDEMRKAYAEVQAQSEFDGNAKTKRRYEKAKQEAAGIDAEVKRVARKVWEADTVAYKARWDTEDAFAAAERRLSGDMAREAARRGVEAYDLREKSIRRAEAAARAVKGEALD
jgi:hypothetical protein